ncbi:MAG TPA: TolC family protein [Pyrinomonadaceae bacterium]|nr:TolC family protein [Pyrinomonadaceae bacterium]
MSLVRNRFIGIKARALLIAISVAMLTLFCLADSQSNYGQTPLPIKERIERDAKQGSKSAVTIPPGVALDDGLSEDEAVSIALWNNPVFNSDLAALGFARADLREAGLLRNPVMSLLFPLGPKQFEATINFPLELIWQRPRRVAAAKANLQRVGKSLEQNALNLVRDVRLAYADVQVAQKRHQLALDALTRRRQIPVIMEARFRVGDISEQEAIAARAEANIAEQEAVRLGNEINIVKERLRFLLGLSGESTPIEITTATIEPTAPQNTDALLRLAFASRPDLRAAELAIDAAAQKAKWERSRIFTLMATLDMNGRGTRGFEAGPGFVTEPPIFNRNQGGISRAEAEVEAASRGYALVRQRIISEVVEAQQQLMQARESLADWRARVLPALERDVSIQNAAYRGGEISYLLVLLNQQRLDAAHVREFEFADQAHRARVQLDRAIGRSSY